MVLGKLRTSGVKTHYGTLAAALNRVFLDLRWKGDKPILSLALPGGMGEEIYRRVWSLDRGFSTEKGEVRGRKIFSLSKSEKSVLGHEVESLAKQFMEQER
jgi:hypothetical protein